jgi:hypothetical protein
MRWPSEEKFEFRWLIYSNRPDIPLTLTFSALGMSDSHVGVTVLRVLSGVTQSHGQLSVIFKNHLPEPTEVAYFESMPWLIQFYLHTLHITSTDGSRSESLVSSIGLRLIGSVVAR